MTKYLIVILAFLFVKTSFANSLCAKEFGSQTSQNLEIPKSLISAIEKGDLEAFSKIMEQASIDPNAVDSRGDALIHIAAFYDRAIIIKELISRYKADINKEDYRGDTALHIAVQNENMIVTVQLYFFGASIEVQNNEGKTPIAIAQENDQKEMLDIFKMSRTISDTDVLISSHDSNLSGMSLVIFDKLSQVFLSDAKSLVDQEGNRPFHAIFLEALEKLNHTKMSRKEEQKFKEYIFGQTYFFAKNEYIDVKNDSGITPLMLAVQHELLISAVKWLSFLGADPSAQDNQGSTPLHYAVLADNFSAFKILIEFISRLEKTEQEKMVTAQNNQGDTFLHTAINQKLSNFALATLLLSPYKNELMVTQNNQGDTPLHALIKTAEPKGLFRMFSILALGNTLIDTNPDSLKVKNNAGDTPVDLLNNKKFDSILSNVLFSSLKTSVKKSKKILTVNKEVAHR